MASAQLQKQPAISDIIARELQATLILETDSCSIQILETDRTSQQVKRSQPVLGNVNQMTVNFATDRTSQQVKQSQPVLGNVNQMTVNFATVKLPTLQFAGKATTYIGNTGITGNLYSDDIAGKLTGNVYFLFHVDDKKTLRMWFYKDPQYTNNLGYLSATGAFTDPTLGLGTGVFTPYTKAQKGQRHHKNKGTKAHKAHT